MPRRRAAVLGHPVEHSLSPVLHRAAYAALGLTDWEYERHDVDEAGFLAFVDALDPSWRGLSLTMPLKEIAAEVADTVSETAQRAGSINTLVRENGGWAADNTDVTGIERAIASAVGPRPGGASGLQRATILGGGATARSALCALERLGAREVLVAARNPAKARAAVERTAAQAGLTVRYGALGDWAGHGADVVISTLAPAGSAAAASALNEASGLVYRPAGEELRGAVLLDVVYADWPTPLARAAATAGLTVVSGLEMLIHQAVRQVELMTGEVCGPQVVEAMASAARTAASGH